MSETDTKLPVVNVYSIDEERLRFRVIIAIAAVANYDGRGEYDVNIPIPTFFGNNEDYNACRIKCDSFAAYGLGALGTPTWGSAAAVKVPALELQLSCPSSQTATSTIDSVAQAQQAGVHEVSGFKQLLPGQIVNVGNGAVFTPAAGGYAWLSMSGKAENPIMAANPFGQKLTIRFIDPASRDRIWIENSAVGMPGPDLGTYVMQLDITMIPNK